MLKKGVNDVVKISQNRIEAFTIQGLNGIRFWGVNDIGFWGYFCNSITHRVL